MIHIELYAIIVMAQCSNSILRVTKSQRLLFAPATGPEDFSESRLLRKNHVILLLNQ